MTIETPSFSRNSAVFIMLSVHTNTTSRRFQIPVVRKAAFSVRISEDAVICDGALTNKLAEFSFYNIT